MRLPDLCFKRFQVDICVAACQRSLAAICLTLVFCNVGFGQNSVPDNLQFGMGVPPDVEQITNKALQYLVESQNENGTWDGGYDSHGRGRENCGVVGLATMAMLTNWNLATSNLYLE